MIANDGRGYLYLVLPQQPCPTPPITHFHRKAKKKEGKKQFTSHHHRHLVTTRTPNSHSFFIPLFFSQYFDKKNFVWQVNYQRKCLFCIPDKERIIPR